jgi:hypothetical protein
MQHPIYNRYYNPYASPVELKDNSVCTECGEPTGVTGESFYGRACGFCEKFFTVDEDFNYGN